PLGAKGEIATDRFEEVVRNEVPDVSALVDRLGNGSDRGAGSGEEGERFARRRGRGVQMAVGQRVPGKKSGERVGFGKDVAVEAEDKGGFGRGDVIEGADACLGMAYPLFQRRARFDRLVPDAMDDQNMSH